MAEDSLRSGFSRRRPNRGDQTLFGNSDPYFQLDFDVTNYDCEFLMAEEFFPQEQIAGMNEGLCERLDQVDELIDLNERLSQPDSMEIVDLLDRGNQASYVMDLFHQRVEQPQIVSEYDMALDLNSAVIEENDDQGLTDLKLGLGLGLEFGRESHHLNLNDSSGLREMDEDWESEDEDEDEDEGGEPSFNIGLPAFESVEARDEQRDSTIGLLGPGSFSDEGNSEMIFGLLLHSESESTIGGHFHEDEEDDAACPLCWDSLRLEDQRETNESLEWEEVGPWVEELEAPSISIDAGDGLGISTTPITLSGIVDDSIINRNMGWQVLFDGSYLERNLELEYGIVMHEESDVFVEPVEYEVMIGQIEQHNEINPTGSPAASKAVVQNLPTVVMTREEADKNDTLCAICKDGINVGENGKILPCTHVYHEECIFPWLDIRNTCPVCRYELPTDDADYEQQRRHHRQ